MSGAWTLRYILSKVAVAAGDVAHSLATSSSSSWSRALQNALAKGLDTYYKELTTVIYLTGAAMSPTLNSRATTDKTAVDTLLMRIIPRPSTDNVFVGDVVAFKTPFRDDSEHGILVRRVAAMEGEEMVSDAPMDMPFTIPRHHCWVLADNQNQTPPGHIDSRSFGPLGLHRICGRIIYNGYSKSDHGVVKNSDQAMIDDSPVLQCELNLDRFLGDAQQ